MKLALVTTLTFLASAAHAAPTLICNQSARAFAAHLEAESLNDGNVQGTLTILGKTIAFHGVQTSLIAGTRIYGINDPSFTALEVIEKVVSKPSFPDCPRCASGIIVKTKVVAHFEGQPIELSCGGSLE